MTAPAIPARPLIRPMTVDDHGEVIALLRQTPGVSIRDADSREATGRYLQRNPQLSFVAACSGALVGCILSGHDGRRGYLQHLVVLPAFRHRGIGAALVERCLASLEHLGILKSHVDVYTDNLEAQRFWERLGWTPRTDIQRYSFVRAGGGDNA